AAAPPAPGAPVALWPRRARGGSHQRPSRADRSRPLFALFRVIEWRIGPMISRVCLLSLLCSSGLLLAAAPQELKKKDAPAAIAVPAGPDDPVVIGLAPQAKAPIRALEWSFQPDELDRVPGNAAQMWLRAGTSARSVRHKWTPTEDDWYGPAG